MDAVTVLFHMVDIILTQDPPPRLNPASGTPYSLEEAEAGPPDYFADGWIFSSVGTALMELLDSLDAAVCSPVTSFPKSSVA